MSEKKSLYEKITDPKVMRILIYVSMVVFLPGIVIAYIVAVATGGTSIPPGAYNMWNNYISDMGSFNYTAAPFILDYIEMITAVLFFPLFFFSKDLALEYLEKSGTTGSALKISKIVIYLRFFSLLVGAVGFFGVGLFSGDRDFPAGAHLFFSAVVFGGLAMGAFWFGLGVMLTESFMPKILGLFMFLGPITSVILFLVKPIPSEPMLEWVMLFCIFFWIIPAGIYELKMIKENGKEK